MEWLLDPFALGFQQRALVGGIVSAVMASTVGVWLVLRGMSFFGDAFMHAVLPGIAAALLLGFSPFLGAAISALVMVAGIEFVHRQTQLKEDTGIGLLFVGMLALGVVIVSRSTSYTGSLTSILFGDALGVTPEAIRAAAILAVFVVATSILMYRPLLALSFGADKARSLGMSPGLTHAVLLVLIAAAVIGSFQTIGTLLVFGLMVGPPATAALLTRSVPQMMAASVVVAVASVWAGLVISYHAGTAGSATMALVPIVAFFVVLLVRTAARSLRSGRARRGTDEAGAAGAGDGDDRGDGVAAVASGRA